MHIPDIIIAVDGYSSTGKSTFAKMMANEFSFLYLDSGALYRGVTLFAQENGIIDRDNEIDEEKLRAALDGLDLHFDSTVLGSQTFLGSRCIEREIRSLEVSSQVSPVSAMPFVREYVDYKLHSFGTSRRVVMDGRDIGTTVFPDAEIKIFLTASAEVRATRRFNEMKYNGEDPVFEEVLNNLLERDYLDSHREVSPLTKADDAFVLDNSNMSIEQEISWARGIVQGKFAIYE